MQSASVKINCIWTPAENLMSKGIYFRTTCCNGTVNIIKCAKKRGVAPVNLLKGECFMCGKEILHAKKVVEK